MMFIKNTLDLYSKKFQIKIKTNTHITEVGWGTVDRVVLTQHCDLLHWT